MPAPAPGPYARYIGPLALDQPPMVTVREIVLPSAKTLLAPAITGRRRTTRVKEDAGPMTIEVRGFWTDDPAGTPRYRDFHAALLNQVQAPFNMGDGSEFRAVDVLDVLPTRLDGVQHDWPGQHAESWSWIAKVLSYEPYARLRNPGMSGPQALTTGVGSLVTNFAANYLGTAPGEPTWQWTLVIPAGVSVSQLQLANSLTGEACVVTAALGAGTYYVLMDSSGADGGARPRTPNNNGYGLLQNPSPGYGASLATGADAPVDCDFSGSIPTLREARGQLTVVAVNNPMLATVTATAALTTASLSWLAPARYVRA